MLCFCQLPGVTRLCGSHTLCALHSELYHRSWEIRDGESCPVCRVATEPNGGEEARRGRVERARAAERRARAEYEAAVRGLAALEAREALALAVLGAMPIDPGSGDGGGEALVNDDDGNNKNNNEDLEDDDALSSSSLSRSSSARAASSSLPPLGLHDPSSAAPPHRASASPSSRSSSLSSLAEMDEQGDMVADIDDDGGGGGGDRRAPPEVTAAPAPVVVIDSAQRALALLMDEAGAAALPLPALASAAALVLSDPGTAAVPEADLKVALSALLSILSEPLLSALHGAPAAQLASALVGRITRARPDLKIGPLGLAARLARAQGPREALKSAGALEALTPLLKSVNDVVKVEAAVALQQLAADVSAKEKLCLSLDAVPPLVAMLRSVHAAVAERAAALLFCLAGSDRCKEVIYRAGALPALLALLASRDPSVAEAAAIAIGYLARLPEVKAGAREDGTLLALLEVVRGVVASGGGEDGGEDARASSASAGGRAKVACRAAGALWTCASDPANRSLLGGLGAIPVLVRLLRSPAADDETRENVAGALWNLAVDPANVELLCEEDAVGAFLDCIAGGASGAVLTNIAGAFWNTTVSASARQQVRARSGMPVLLEALQGALRVRNFVGLDSLAGALRNCLILEDNKREFIALHGPAAVVLAVTELFDLYASAPEPLAPVLEKLFSTILILTTDRECKVMIREADGLPVLLAAMDLGPAIHAKATGALRNLATNGDNKALLRELGAFGRFVASLSHPAALSREYAASAIGHCARNEDNRRALALAGAVEALVRLLPDPALEVANAAADALATLMVDPANRAAAGQAGAVQILVGLLANPATVAASLSALKAATTSSQDNVGALLRTRGGFQAVLSLVKADKPDEDSTVLRDALSCLRHLSEGLDSPSRNDAIAQVSLFMATSRLHPNVLRVAQGCLEALNE
jgi:hypothetical protein